MNAIELLKKDHRLVESLFRQFERAGERAVREKKALAERIIKELSVHAAVEEQLLYPAARARDEKLKDVVLESLEEHHVAKWTLDELERMPVEDERFEAKMTVLIENIKHHIEEEEGDLFPRMIKVFSRDELKALGEAMVRAKAIAPTHPHPMSPDTPPGNVIVAPLAKILDAGRDMATSIVRRTMRAAAKTRRAPGKGGKARRLRSRG